MKKYTGNNNLNDIFYEIVNILLLDDSQDSIDLKKLLYYGNETDKDGNIIYVNPYAKEEVYEDLYNENIFQYDYLFDVQNDSRNIINIHIAGGDINRDNYCIEDNYFMIDIYVHKSMEAIDINNKRISRSIEILNKIRKLLDGRQLKIGLNNLELQGFDCGKVQNRYLKTTCTFKIMNIR
ncbi:hypothetical protein [Clostridium rectalis]|uniref:hypothetical protein n=1 Tax=Clostridium rectalis TaxID=2040295 RepID=UPI000F641D50|nr:hypothetical protein [Clostridium rectalis]